MQAICDALAPIIARRTKLQLEMRDALRSGDLATALDKACSLTNVKRSEVIDEFARQHESQQSAFVRMLRSLPSI